MPQPEDPPVVQLTNKDDAGEFLLSTFPSQDAMAWETQGAIANRPGEHLGSTDRGIILFRKMLSEQLDLVEQGGDPLGLVWDPGRNQCITFNDETEWARWEQRARETNRQDVLEVLQAGISFREGYVDTVGLTK